MRFTTRAALAVVLTWGMGVSSAMAQAQPAEACAPAGSRVRIEAKSELFSGAITYAVINNRRERLRWVRIGTGGNAFTVLPPDQTPSIAATPANWRGVVARSGGSDRVHFSWEAANDEAELTFRSRTEFAVRARAAYVARPGLLPLYLTSLPFSVGTSSGSCWWGRTTDPTGPPGGGWVADIVSGSVRTISGGGTDYVIVDAPAGDLMIRLHRKPVFVTIPAAVSWGIKGGFSADASIGIGMSWSPSKYVSASAKTSFGTFFFNNRTHLRGAGLEVNIPIAREAFAEGVTRQSKYLVFGVEYFHRDVVRWKGFMKGPQWYASGHGVAFRVGVRRLSWSY